MTVYTDLSGRIREASEEGCELFGTAAHRLVNRRLPLFFVENRHRALEMMDAAGSGLPMQLATVLHAVKGGRHRVLVQIDRVGSVHQNLLEWIVLHSIPNRHKA